MKVDQKIIDNILVGWEDCERIIEIPFVFKNLPEPPTKILDVGCCESQILDTLGRLGFDNWGIDMRNCYESFIRFIQGDARKMKFKDNEFDIVTCVSTLEHIGLVDTPYYTDKVWDKDGDKRAMKEMVRVVKKGGLIILTLSYGQGSLGLSKWIRFYNKIKIAELFSGLEINILKEQYSIQGKELWDIVDESIASKIISEENKVLANVCFLLTKT
jgi:SAM-dependent methyltransferase